MKVFGPWGRKGVSMSYTAKDYGHLLGMSGFSDTLLKNHFTIYQGYVTNTKDRKSVV